MNPRSTAGAAAVLAASMLSIAPIALTAATAAPDHAHGPAAAKPVNLIVDGGAEKAKIPDSDGDTVPVPGWTPSGKSSTFTAVPYGSPEFPTKKGQVRPTAARTSSPVATATATPRSRPPRPTR